MKSQERLSERNEKFSSPRKPQLVSADANREGSPRGLAGQEAAAAGRKGRKRRLDQLRGWRVYTVS